MSHTAIYGALCLLHAVLAKRHWAQSQCDLDGVDLVICYASISLAYGTLSMLALLGAS
jgi:hypothetical protein